MPRLPAPIPGFRPALPTRALLRCLAAAAVAPGEGDLTPRFERAFARTLGTSEAVALPSVRLGLLHALEGLGVRRGSRILCTPLTVYPVVGALRGRGFGIRFVDLEADSLCMDVDSARAAMSPEVGALLVTHLWGVPGDVAALADLAREHGVPLIEDASQCLGGEVAGRKAGTFGAAGLFSLGWTKTVTSLSGAVLAADDRELADRIRLAAAHLPPLGRRRFAREAGISVALRGLTSPVLYRMGGARVMDRLRRSGPVAGEPAGEPVDPIATVRHGFGDPQARPALASLARFGVEQRRRGEIAASYRRGLEGLADLRMAAVHADRREGYWAFAVFHPRAEALRGRLRRAGVDAVPSSVDACHELPGAPELRAELPTASRLQRECTCLPIHGSMGERDVDHVIHVVREFCERG